MTPENFCYWLQGLMELENPTELNPTQIRMIKEHLQLVFKKETKLDINDQLIKSYIWDSNKPNKNNDIFPPLLHDYGTRSESKVKFLSNVSC